MDSLYRDLFWGFGASNNRQYYPKSWSLLSSPTCTGGLGLKKMEAFNRSMVTKLAWSVHLDDHKPWVQLIRARYLRGMKLLDVQATEKAVSWVWGSIRQCIPTLQQGTCFQVSINSKVDILEDPWLLIIADFRIPNQVRISPNLQFFKHLMKDGEAAWDKVKISIIFPLEIVSKIINSPILEEGQERLIWVPSLIGKFLVKITYHLIIQ